MSTENVRDRTPLDTAEYPVIPYIAGGQRIHIGAACPNKCAIQVYPIMWRMEAVSDMSYSRVSLSTGGGGPLLRGVL